MSRRMFEIALAGLVAGGLIWMVGPTAYRKLALNPTLEHAVDYYDLPAVQRLVARGANVNLRLGRASGRFQPSTPLILAAHGGDTANVQKLLARGADPNLPGVNGDTPLMRAMGWANLATVDALLRAGANVNARDAEGKTPLMWLATGFWNHLERVNARRCAQIAFEHGADLNVEVEDYTAAAMAEESGPNSGVAKVLHRLEGRDRDSCLDAIAARGAMYAVRSRRLGAVKRVAARGVSFDVADADGTHPLIAAATQSNPEILRFLLAHGRDARALVNRPGPSEQTALCAAARERFGGDMAPLLLAAGADPDVKDAYDRTALSYAAEAGWRACVRILLAAGAATDIPDDEGKTPLAHAENYGDKVVIALLRQAGARK